MHACMMMYVYNINNYMCIYIYIYISVCVCITVQQQDQCSTMHGDIVVYCFPHGLPSTPSSPWGSDVDPIHMASANKTTPLVNIQKAIEDDHL